MTEVTVGTVTFGVVATAIVAGAPGIYLSNKVWMFWSDDGINDREDCKDSDDDFHRAEKCRMQESTGWVRAHILYLKSVAPRIIFPFVRSAKELVIHFG
jgi:hypothetical protein